MNEFIVRGPYVFKPENWTKRRIFTRESADQFKEQHKEILSKPGCYIFALKASQGYKPWYVGKTDKSFYSEAFTPDKLQKYNEVAASSHRGTPLLFFLQAPGRVGEQRKRRIAELELYLIQSASKKNPKLINIKGAKGPDWGIRGILRCKRGTSNKSSQIFKRIMSW